mmetsp:Transcript_4666/g.12971  ORF Transcript_4666/g.12971 Transcript_4666/m.12971 type:complete len:370 (+) Transcript_4666:194-1303(+)
MSSHTEFNEVGIGGEEVSAKGSPWQRLREAVEYAFTSADPDLPVPPVPSELKQWGEFTSLSLGFGIFYSGLREWAKVRALPPVEHPAHAVNQAQAARLIAEENTLRVLRVQRAAVRGGMWVGSIAGVYFATAISSRYARDVHDVWNIVLGGTVAGSSTGLLFQHGLIKRIGGGIAGAAAGALISYPSGMLQLALEQWSYDLAKTAGLTSEADSNPATRWKQPPNFEVVEGKYMPVLPQSREGTTEEVIAILERNLEPSSGASAGQQPPAVDGDGKEGRGWLAWAFGWRATSTSSPAAEQREGGEGGTAEDQPAPGGPMAGRWQRHARLSAESQRAAGDRQTEEMQKYSEPAAHAPDYRFWPFVRSHKYN